MKLNILIIISHLFFISNSQVKPAKISEELKLVWKSKIGQTSFRTNVSFLNNHLIIGSNGDNYHDYLQDERYGVYFINKKSGAIERHFANDNYGDMDVNGVLVYNNRLYFGNDNEEILCTDLNGNIKWRNNASGDIESEPVMINNKGTDQLVYATELGEIRSVNPKDGKTNWVYYNRDFSGWTEEDNRLFFKIRAYATSGYIYMEKPLLKDVNGDGVVDLFYQSVSPSESCIEVIDGASGKLIWESFDEEKSAYGFNKINKLPNGNIIEFQKVPNDNIPSYKRKAVAKLFNNQGVVISSYELDALSCWQGASSCLTEKSLIVPFTNKIFEFDNTLSLKEHNFNFPIIYHSEYWGDYKDNSFKADFVSSGVFRYRDYKNCIAVLTERMVATDGTSSKAAVTIYSLDQEKVIKHLILPASSEFPPVIRDVNGDGRLNMLVSCRDGYLYCFDLELSSDDLVSQ